MAFKADVTLNAFGDLILQKETVEVRVESRGTQKVFDFLRNEQTGERIKQEQPHWEAFGQILIFVNNSEIPFPFSEKIHLKNYDPDQGIERQLYEEAKKMDCFTNIENI